MAEANVQTRAPLNLEDFIEAASRAALRAVDSQASVELNPQPLPPKANESTLRPPRIFVGIVAFPQ